MKTAGFVGTGKMGGALAGAVIEKIGAENVALCDNDISKAYKIGGEKALVLDNAAELCKNAKFIFLGVKPQMLGDTANELKDTLESLNTPVVLVSMMAGVSLKRLKDAFGNLPIIRIMPNTPVLVNQGMIAYCKNELVSEKDLEDFLYLLSLAGKTESVPEELFDAVTSVSGCGPAFVYMFVKSLAEGGVAAGLSYELALSLAKQTVLGATELLIKSGESPDKLRDDVCSKGGSTIEGVKALEQNTLSETIKKAVLASFERNKQL